MDVVAPSPRYHRSFRSGFQRLVSVIALWSAIAMLPVSSVHALRSQSSDVVILNDIEYGLALDENGDIEVLDLDLYVPPEAVSHEGSWRPALVVLHGGFFSHGDKAEPAVVAMADYAARLGYVVASINYRLRLDQGPDYPIASSDAQHDAQAAVRWLRTHGSSYSVDPGRIGIAGFSAGGIASMRVATALPTDPGSSGNPGPPSSVAVAVGLSSFLPVEVGSVESDILLLNGEDDPVIRVEWAQDTCDRWRRAGGHCDLVIIPDGDHDASVWIGAELPALTNYLDCRLGAEVGFSDLDPGTAAMRDVAWASARDVVSGSDRRSFRPSSGVTRAQFAVWVWKLMGRPQASTQPAFSDVASVSRSYRAVAWATEQGVLFARPTGAFSPQRIVQRSSAAMALWRLAGRPIDGDPGAVPGLDTNAPYAPAVGWWAAHNLLGAFRSPAFDASAPLLRLQGLRLLKLLSMDQSAWRVPPDQPLCFGPS